jgi:hypothetical protein
MKQASFLSSMAGLYISLAATLKMVAREPLGFSSRYASRVARLCGNGRLFQHMYIPLPKGYVVGDRIRTNATYACDAERWSGRFD